jgi:D-alanyl-D-alanine dipeptidase
VRGAVPIVCISASALAFALAAAVVADAGAPGARSSGVARDAGTGPARDEGAGVARPVFPSRDRLRSARAFLRARRGVESFALIDSRGRAHRWAGGRLYVSASLVKAMLLVAYLRGIDHRLPTPAERAVLGPMITVSSNRRANQVYARVGDASLQRLARRARMRSFSVHGHWANAHVSALDQARFFFRLDRLVPGRSRPYARRLLSSVVRRQRWGFSRFSLPTGFATFMKGGWRATAFGRLVHEAALFERGRTRFSMAVLTDGNPSHAYGTATLRGVARRIFAADAPAAGSAAMRGADAPAAGSAAASAPEAGSRATRRAGLVDAHRFAPGIAVELVYRTDGNLTGHRLQGYCRDWALLHEPAARSLARVQRFLRRRGLGLLVLDAYRPARASRALVRWAERSGRGDLVGTYIARRSRHNTGAAVDLTLVRLSDARRVRMGRYDALGPGAHTLAARGRVLRNRLTLKRAMERFGFTNYWREWWHFEHRVKPDRYLDVTLGC